MPPVLVNEFLTDVTHPLSLRERVGVRGFDTYSKMVTLKLRMCSMK